MPKNTQLLWIAKAEARRYQDEYMAQRACFESPRSIVSAMRNSARGNRWRRLIARLMDDEIARLAPSAPPCAADLPAPPARDAVRARIVLIKR